jgi:undecaprenyl-diphosphatase
MGKIIRYLGSGILLLCFWGAIFNWGFAQGAKLPGNTDVFATGAVQVAPGEEIGRLLVRNGNAVVAGTVTKGIVLVNGNLSLTATAHVNGAAVVINGGILHQAGARVNGGMWAIAGDQLPKIKTLLAFAAVAGFLAVTAASYAVWLLWKRFKKSLYYPQAVSLVQHKSWLVPAAALFLIGFMAALFMDLAWQTLIKHTMYLFDNMVISAVRFHSGPELDRIMVAISALGYGYAYAMIIAVTFGLLFLYRKWQEITAVFLSLAGGAGLDYLLKTLFARARPEMLQVVHAGGYSFPSGHAMVSLCFYGMVAYLASSFLRPGMPRAMLAAIAVLLILAIGISRIYLGVHYPTDIVAGYAAGAAWLLFCILVYAWKKPGHVD